MKLPSSGPVSATKVFGAWNVPSPLPSCTAVPIVRWWE